MRFRRSITTMGATALVGVVLPVAVASPAFAACGDTEPPCTVIDETTGTPKEVIDGGFGTSTSDTASFTFGVDGNTVRITYECQLERNGVAVSAFTACVSPVTYPGLTNAGYKFSVRATRQPQELLGIPLGQPVLGTTDTYLWDVELPSGGGGGAPNTLIGNVPPRWHTDNWFSIDLLSGSSATTYECKLDGRVRPCDTGNSDDLFTLFGTGMGDHSVSVAAMGSDGRRDPTPATARFTVPNIASRMQGLKGGWTKQTKLKGPMLEQHIIVAKKGASINRYFNNLRTIALVVTKAPRSGKLKVFINDRQIKVIDLSSSTVRYRQVVKIKTFKKRSDGRLRIQSANKKPVRVEALGLSAF